MEFKKEKLQQAYAIKFTAQDAGKIIGRVYLYVLTNDLHQEPFGFLEDLFVEEEYRKQGIGSQLVEKAIAEAKEQKCYKLICTSRQANEKIHTFYERLGFQKYGYEFRMDIKKSE